MYGTAVRLAQQANRSSHAMLKLLAFELLKKDCTIGTCSEGSHFVATHSIPSAVLGASCRRSRIIKVW